jgi:catechol 2,3-dioxygenase-like lactoylglutathione lyase family enzyme
VSGGAGPSGRRVDKMFLGLRTVVYPASDMEAAKEWFTKVLGVGPYFDEPFYVGYNVGGYELGIVPREAGGGQESPTTYWGVPDAAAALAELLAAGAEPHSEVTDVGDGILVAAVREPSGSVLGIIENPHFEIAEVSLPGAGRGR